MEVVRYAEWRKKKDIKWSHIERHGAYEYTLGKYHLALSATLCTAMNTIYARLSGFMTFFIKQRNSKIALERYLHILSIFIRDCSCLLYDACTNKTWEKERTVPETWLYDSYMWLEPWRDRLLLWNIVCR